jgi:hypothetical protein
VTEALVELLEMIEIDQQDRQLSSLAGVAGELVFEALVGHAVVRDLGQRTAGSEGAELRVAGVDPLAQPL